MNHSAVDERCVQFPIAAYDALERELHAARQRLNERERRFTALTEQLEQITRSVPPVQVISTERRRRGFEFFGTFFPAASCIAIHFAVLRLLWTKYPELRDGMACAAARNSRSRTYIARSPEALYHGKSAHWARRHSRPLVDGWVIDTNMNPAQMEAILRAVLAAAGLKWGKDVKVMWQGS